MTWKRIVLLAVVVGILLQFPSLWLGFVPSDLGILPVLERWYPEIGQPFNVYASFFDMPGYPWWIASETRLEFCRPLASALLHLDHWLYGRNAVGYHLHSLLWLGGLIAVCGLLYSRLPRGLGALALVLLAFDECHFISSGWICGRHAVVAAVLALLGLLAHLRWREQGWRPGLPLSLAGFAGGLLAGETALSILAFAFAWELFAFRPAPGGPAAGQRLLGVLPLVLVAGAYLLFYRTMGYGAFGLGYYLNPTGDAILLLSGLAVRVPALVAAAVLGFPASLWYFEICRPLQIALGVAALPGAAALLWHWRAHLESSAARQLRWLIPGSLAALIPAAFASPDERQLLVPMIGLAPVTAFFLRTAWRRWHRGWAGRAWRRVAAGALVLLLVAANFVLPVALRAYGFIVTRSGYRFYTRIAAQLPLDPARRGEQQLIAINTPGYLTYFPQFLDLHGPPIASSWNVLSAAPHDLRLRRTGPRTLELEIADGQLLHSAEEREFRPPRQRLAPGDVIETALFQVEILEINDRGPTRVAFDFHRPIDDPDLLFMAWQEEAFEQVEPPAVGETLTLKWSPLSWW